MSAPFLVWLAASRRQQARIAKQYNSNLPAGIV
jgi:hypothetical protein